MILPLESSPVLFLMILLYVFLDSISWISRKPCLPCRNSSLMYCSMLGVSHFPEKLIQWTPYPWSELRAPSAEGVLRHSHRAMRSSLHGISFAALGRSACCSGVRLSSSDLLFAKLHRWCYSTRRKSAPRVPKMEHQASGEKKDAFYVVRKGDLVGVYKSFKECQEQLSSFVSSLLVAISIFWEDMLVRVLTSKLLSGSMWLVICAHAGFRSCEKKK